METVVTKGEQTRAQIVDTAYGLFSKHGYHGTSIRQIADRAGIALGGIYNHFHGKEEIFEAVPLKHHLIYEVLPALEASRGETVEEMMRSAASLFVAALDHRPELINLMFIEQVEFNGAHIPSLFQSFYPQLAPFMERLRLRQDQLRPIPVPLLIRAFIGLFISFSLTDLLIGNLIPDEMRQDALDHFVDIYLHGILRESR